MAAIAIDAILAKMELAVGKVQATKGSVVLHPTAELDLLVQLERARDFMMSVLRSEDRLVLQSIFAGDCVRISKIRAVLDFAQLADNKERGIRVSSVLNACESVERVLGDLGLGFTLNIARAREKELLAEKAAARVAVDIRHAPESGTPTHGCQMPAGQVTAHRVKSPPRMLAVHVHEPCLQRLPQLLTSPQPMITKRLEREKLGEDFDNFITTPALKSSHLPAESSLQPTTTALPEKAVVVEGCDDFISLPAVSGSNPHVESTLHPLLSQLAEKAEASEDTDDFIPTLEAESSNKHKLVDTASTALRKVMQLWPKDKGDMHHPTAQAAQDPSTDAMDTPRATLSDGSMETPSSGSQYDCTEPEVLTCLAEEANELTSEHTSPRITSLLSPGSSTVDLPDAREDITLGLPSLSPSLQRLVFRTFAFYTATDGTSVGSGLSLSRFRCFLRDCGLLSAGFSVDLAVASAGPNLRRICLSNGHVDPAHLLVETHTSASSTAVHTLPLALFPEAPITLVQAGLLYENSANSTRKEKPRGQAEHRFRIGGAEKLGAQGQMQTQMTFDAFVWAITHVAIYCQKMSFLTTSGTADDGLRAFCEEVLMPLGQVLGVDGEELDSALALIAGAEVCSLMQRGRRGFEAIFTGYAVGKCQQSPYTRGHWTAQAIKRFATDIELVADFSHASLQRLFDQCVQHEVDQGYGIDGKMSFACFQIALVMIAQKLHNSPNCAPIHRLALLMMRLSVSKGAGCLLPIARSVLPASGGLAKRRSVQPCAQQKRVSLGTQHKRISLHGRGSLNGRRLA